MFEQGEVAIGGQMESPLGCVLGEARGRHGKAAVKEEVQKLIIGESTGELSKSHFLEKMSHLGGYCLVFRVGCWLLLECVRTGLCALIPTTVSLGIIAGACWI